MKLNEAATRKDIKSQVKPALVYIIKFLRTSGLVHVYSSLASPRS
jgi:hypothetical protein